MGLILVDGWYIWHQVNLINYDNESNGQVQISIQPRKSWLVS